MPVITVNDQQYALHPGENRLGGGADAEIRVSPDAALGVQAIVDVAQGHPIIRRATTVAAVRVNGVALIDPTPLMHGDKVEIGGTELLYSDDAKAGSTRVVSLSEIATIAAGSDPKRRATSATGGRLVSLVDGKEYAVPKDGLTIGRDASCAVVLTQTDVSRRHALIIPVDAGYEIRDSSSNGILVNGARVDVSRLLSQSDVIQIGGEEFRFHADAPLAALKSPPAAARATPATADPLADTRPVLAILQHANVGPTNGQRHEIRTLLVHVGRGAHNDVSINDASVSDSHAKLQYRDRAWYITDLGSRNGTYVGGVRFTGERRLYGNVELRTGNVKMMFRPTGVMVDTPKETRVIASIDRSKVNTAASPAAPVAANAPAALPEQGVSPWLWTVVVIAMVAVAALFLLNP